MEIVMCNALQGQRERAIAHRLENLQLEHIICSYKYVKEKKIPQNRIRWRFKYICSCFEEKEKKGESESVEWHFEFDTIIIHNKNFLNQKFKLVHWVCYSFRSVVNFATYHFFLFVIVFVVVVAKLHIVFDLLISSGQFLMVIHAQFAYLH